MDISQKRPNNALYRKNGVTPKLTTFLFIIVVLFSLSSCTSTQVPVSSNMVCGFERPPYIAFVELKNGEVVDDNILLFGIHARPKKVYYELNMLDDVIEETVEEYVTKNVLALGDFNADCSYLSDSAYNSLDLIQKGYNWPIGKNEDTTVSSTDCAYDRFAFKGNTLNLDENRTGILRSNIDSSISDHYLIYTTITANGNDYKIAAFNIKKYGSSKASDQGFTNTLKSILSNYDITLIQEITGKDQGIIDKIIPNGYSYVISQRLGTTSYKEQYSYIYNSKIDIKNSYTYSGKLCVEKNDATENRTPKNKEQNFNPSNACNNYDCSSDIYKTPGGQCRSRNKNGRNVRIKDCCCQ